MNCITLCGIVLVVAEMLLQVSVNCHSFTQSLWNSQNVSKPLTEVIHNIPGMIDEDYKDFQLHFIYDKYYQDVMHSLTNTPAGLRGTKMISCDWAQKAISWVLSPVDGEAMIVLLCPVDQVLQFFQLIEQKRLKDTLGFWIVVLRSSEDEHWIQMGLKKLVLEGTRITFLSRLSQETYRISVSNVDVDGITRINKIIQNLNMNDGNRSLLRRNPLVPIFPDNRIFYSDLKGRTLKVSSMPTLLYSHLGPANEDGIISEYSGIEFTALEVLSEKLNFRILVVKCVDGAWGNLQPDGTVTGMVGMVYRQEADLALPLISVTSSRSRVVDYTTPYLYEPKSILSKAPGEKASPFIIFSPFTATVWLCIVVVTLSMGSVLQLLSETTKEPLGSFQETLFDTYRSIVNQGELLSDYTPWTLRTIFYSWYLFCFVILAHYTGTLVSMLAIPSREKPIDSLTDLPKAVSEGFTVSADRGTYIVYLFRAATEGIYRDTWLLFNERSLVENSEGYDLVLQEKFAYIEVKSVLEAEAIMRGKEKYHVGRETFSGSWVGLVINKRAPYKTNFDRIILHMMEGGLINKWKSDEHRKLEKTKVKIESSGPKAMEIKLLQAAFYVLLLGEFVATIVFGIEKIVL